MVLFDFFAVIVSAYLCVRNYKNFTLSARYIMYFFFVLFYVFPLALDCFYMMPDYTRTRTYYGFNLSYNDPATRIIYDTAILFSQHVLLHFQCRTAPVNCTTVEFSKKTGRRHVVVFVFFMLLPILLTFVLPVNKAILFFFQWREMQAFPVNSAISFLEKLSFIGVTSSLLILLDKRNKKILRFMSLVCVCCNICIQGKRAILFFSVVVTVIILIPGLRNCYLTIKKRRKLMRILSVSAVVAGIIMVIMTIWVKVTSRGYSANEAAYMYTTVRIDFLRDDRVRMAIYSLLNPNKIHILDYPGQTIWPIPVWTFPFDYIFGHIGINPPSYAAYLSAGMEGLQIEQSYLFMTPCFYAELVSNFGFLGFILDPILMVWLAKKADKYAYPCNILILVSYVALNLFAIKYIAYFLEFVLLILLLSRKKVTIGRIVL